jgi:hypothetical protein
VGNCLLDTSGQDRRDESPADSGNRHRKSHQMQRAIGADFGFGVSWEVAGRDHRKSRRPVTGAILFGRLTQGFVLDQALFAEAGESERRSRRAAAFGGRGRIILPPHEIGPNQWPYHACVLRRVSTAGALPQIGQEGHLFVGQFHR